MATPAVNLPIHEHPLFPSVRCIKGECDGCHVNGFMYSGYYCNEPYCYIWFHKECAEAPAEIKHSFHPQHSLLLTNVSRDGPCDLCGQKLLPPFYSCSTCEFKVDLICGMKPSPPAIEHPLCHDHPVVFLKIREEKVPCELCKESIEGPSYSCLECDVYFHVDCVHLSKEVNHPCHSIHPLKLIAFESLTDDAKKSCLLCGLIPAKNLLYHCSICNFTSCLGCTKNPPPLVFVTFVGTKAGLGCMHVFSVIFLPKLRVSTAPVSSISIVMIIAFISLIISALGILHAEFVTKM